MATTQEHIAIEDIKDNIMLLKDGGATVVLKTSAVNFGLLSPDEQMAIIGSFAQMLNSLSFAIQILILSQRLDISSYLKLLDKSLSIQINPLLAKLMINYRQFVQSLIKDNEVLDKSFYIALSVSHLEMGIGLKTIDDRLKKAKTILEPRRDQVMRQLSRIGLKADQLEEQELLRLFYEIYNTPGNQTNPKAAQPDVSAAPIEPTPPADLNPMPPAHLEPAPPPTLASVQPIPTKAVPAPAIQSQPLPQSRPRSHPFIVEELTESP